MRPLNGFIAVLFLLVVSSGFIQQAVVCVDFYINQDAIAEKYCVNKADLELKCNGKCHLMKMLKQNSTGDEEPQFPINKLKSFSFYFVQEHTTEWAFNHTGVASLIHFSPVSSTLQEGVTNSLLDPPDFVV